MKSVLTPLFFRQELEGIVHQEAAAVHEELRLQGRDQGRQGQGKSSSEIQDSH